MIDWGGGRLAGAVGGSTVLLSGEEHQWRGRCL